MTWHFIIQNPEDDYWCNDNGWTEHREWAACYVNTNPRLPMEGRWVQITNREAFRIAMGKLRDDADGSDMWGWGMGWLFDLCGFIMIERELRPPSEVQYRPGALGPDVTDDPWHRDIMRDLTDDQLMYCIKALHRYTDLLERNGESY